MPNCCLRTARLLAQKFNALLKWIIAGFHDVYSNIVNLCDNAGWFVSHHAPLTVFTICILFYAIILFIVACHIRFATNLRNPDVSKDWNMFLKTFSDLELCILQHNVTLHSDSVRHSRRTFTPASRAVLSRPMRQHIDRVETHTSMMTVNIQPTREFLKVKHDITVLSTSIYGKYLGVKDANKNKQLNVTIIVPYSWQPQLCPIDVSACETVARNVCVEFQGPKDMFPSSHLPKPCSLPKLEGTTYYAGLNWRMPDPDSLMYCRHRSMVRLHHKPDPALTVWITKEQRRVTTVRLFRLSYFLASFVVVILIYAAGVNHARRRRLTSVSDTNSSSQMIMNI